MAYEVLARKWRPQQFSDVVGQDHVTRTLINAIESGRVAHAYLFVGPRGTGKTSTARILAKALNCVKGSTPTPCDQCDSCREIIAGSSLDVQEFDAASNTGVDYIRELRESVSYAPTRGPFKVYIIDEVHMLSNSSFNALLKTLEEPPPHVKFIFATTEPQKIPATIISRCQRFDLRRIAAGDIIQRLSEIAQAEQVELDDDALLAIARGAEGGLRDAESAMDQLISFRGKKICENDVLSVFGLVARKTLDDLASALLQGDAMKALALVAELDRAGKDFQRLIQELIEHYRDVLVCLHAGQQAAGLDITDARLSVLKGQAAQTDTARVLRVVEVLTETEARLRYSMSRRTLLEIAMVRCARAAKAVTLEEILQTLSGLRGSGAVAHVAEARPAFPAPAPVAPVSEKKVIASSAVETVADEPVEELSEEPVGDPIQRLSKRWHEVVERAGNVAALAKTYLKDAKPLRMVGQHVTIGFDPEFAANKDKLMSVPRGQKAVQHALSEILRQNVTVEMIVLDAKSTLPGDIKMIDGSGAPTKAAPKTRQEWINNPVVKKTLEMFNGGLLDIRE